MNGKRGPQTQNQSIRDPSSHQSPASCRNKLDQMISQFVWYSSLYLESKERQSDYAQVTCTFLGHTGVQQGSPWWKEQLKLLYRQDLEIQRPAQTIHNVGELIPTPVVIPPSSAGSFITMLYKLFCANRLVNAMNYISNDCTYNESHKEEILSSSGLWWLVRWVRILQLAMCQLIRLALMEQKPWGGEEQENLEQLPS